MQASHDPVNYDDAYAEVALWVSDMSRQWPLGSRIISLPALWPQLEGSLTRAGAPSEHTQRPL